jgi:hypothetical protein
MQTHIDQINQNIITFLLARIFISLSIVSLNWVGYSLQRTLYKVVNWSFVAGRIQRSNFAMRSSGNFFDGIRSYRDRMHFIFGRVDFRF